MRLIASVLVIIIAMGVWVKISLSTPATLPAPTGPYAIGRMEFDWVDESRSDPFVSAQKRELDTFLWYPAEQSGTKPAVYLRENWERNLQSPILWSTYSGVHTNSWEGVPIARTTQKPWPVVVLSTGFGHVPADYTSLAEELASQGYIVASPANTHTGPTVIFPDGRIAKNKDDILDLKRTLRVWADDIGTVLKKLESLDADSGSPLFHKLDFSRVGIIGHSFGGAASAEFCSNQGPCNAGVDMDGSLFGGAAHNGIRKPFLFLLNEGIPPWWACLRIWRKHTWEELHREDMMRFRAACDPWRNCRIECLPGLRHQNFSDLAVMFRPPLYWAHPKLGRLSGKQGLEMTRQKVTEFLNQWVRG